MSEASTETIIECEVLIVGYGPVGATIAALLGQYGIDVLVIERAEAVLQAPRAIALDNEALRILQMAGLADDAFERIAIPQVRMHSPWLGEFGRVNTCGAINGHPKLVTFYQPDLEHALRARVAQHRSARVMTGVEFETLRQDQHGVQAQLRDRNQARLRIQARFLIGADGASSKVRHAIGQDFAGRSYSEDWLIVDAKQVPNPIDHVEFWCDPRRPTPHMVTPGGRQRWEFMLQAGETREEMEKLETIHALLAPWASPEQIQIERKAVYRFHARCCQAFANGSVFLAGDAAHITPPFIGQGLVAGLRDAANLSWKLAWVLRHAAAPGILGSYDQERRPHARAMIALAKWMGRLVMPGNRCAAILGHGSVRLLRKIPGLGRLLDEAEIKPNNRFGHGLFIAGRGSLTTGAPLPQGLLRRGRDPIIASDEVLGCRLSLIGFGLHPASFLGSAAAAAWQAGGGQLLQICHRGQQLHRGDDAWEDMEGILLPSMTRFGTVAVIRPDRVVLHQGPASETDHIVQQSLALLGLA